MDTNVVAPVAKKPQTSTRERNMIPPLLLVALGVGVVTVWLLGREYDVIVSTTLIWGLALYVSGALIGFLFGIPKVPDRVGGGPVGENAEPNPPANSADGASGAQNSPQDLQRVEKAGSKRDSGINSNLVEVSDWLTKIIVGVGLVELKNLPTYGESLAGFMAKSLTRVPSPTLSPTAATLTSVAGAVALYFGVLGFITGYLMTRIFLAIIMNDADRSAEEASGWRLSAGEIISTPTMLGGLVSAMNDLQGKVVQLLGAGKDVSAPQATAPSTLGRSAGGPSTVPPTTSAPDAVAPDEGAVADAALQGPVDDETKPPADPVLTRTVPPALDVSPIPSTTGETGVRRIRATSVLWVDDRPQRNALIVDRLRAAGAQVQQATTTAEALDRLTRGSYELIITDMHRGEKAADGRPSGLRFLEALGKLLDGAAGTRPMVALYCSRPSYEKYGEQARRSGADLATSSEIELLSALSKRFLNVG